MKKTKLKIGRIPYANLFPIFYYLEKECSGSAYKFIRGVPSKLNKMLRSGELDVSISSSIEYLRNKDKYRILPWFSISSSGAIKSILLFSRLPINELGGKKIALTSDSETSVVLLKIILKEFLSLKCKFTPVNRQSVKNILSSFDAVLHIGDTAMREAKKIVKSCKLKVKSEKPKTKLNSSLSTLNSQLYIYDLGELWDKYTGLPFVFALWIVRKETAGEKKELVRKLSSDLVSAGKYAKRKYPLIAREAPQKKWLSEKELVGYWKIISYDFTEKHLEGLKLFEKYEKKL
ncbi:MAG: menaquinone biosynthesis protein [Nitrospirae bacterium]|nr:menaquinone biosynthesis protein [Nitrospirota bacterium]